METKNPKVEKNSSEDNPCASREVIVSGATGFIGQHLVPLLLQRQYDVIAIGRDEDKARRFAWYDKVRFVKLDFHKESASFAFSAGAGLIHLAWQGLPNYSGTFHFEENLPKNYSFIKGLVSSGVGKVLVSGTCFEYGMQNGGLSPCDRTYPANPYGLAKDILRRYLEYFQTEKPFALQWARLFYMYGHGQNPKSLIAQLDEAIERGDASFNMSGGEQLRDYLPVEEAARMLVDIYEAGAGGIFNVCSGKPVSIRNLVENRVRQKGSPIKLNLGYYPYADYEPMAFWGKREEQARDD
jgi:nucleoside-diphosphate-sugar epimerase